MAAAWPLFGLFACHGPNPDYLGVDGFTDTTNTATTTTGTHTDESTHTGEDSATDTSDTETSGGSETSSTGDFSCGDGMVDPGEFCFEHAELLATTEVQSLAVADFDADTHLDVAIGRKDEVLVLFGDGTGSFPLQAQLSADSGDHLGAAAGLLDADPRADLVVSHKNGDELLIYRSLGGGSFSAPASVPLAQQPTRLLLAQVDGDAQLDALVLLPGSDELAVLHGDGNTGFGAPAMLATGGDEPVELGLASFDQGSGFDIVVANHASQHVALLHGTGPGQFAAPVLYPLSGKPRGLAIADFNLDGSPDVAAVLEDLDAIEILLGDGNGGLDNPVFALTVGSKPVAALARDLDGDGAVDLAVLNLDDRSVGVLFNDPDAPGSFSAHQTLLWFDGFTRLTSIIAGDLDGDGVDDVIIGGDGVEAMLSNP